VKPPSRKVRRARLLLYVETVCVDHAGIPNMRRMNSEDLTFANELEDQGYLVNHGTGTNQRWRLTDKGWAEATRLRRARADRMWRAAERETRRRMTERLLES